MNMQEIDLGALQNDAQNVLLQATKNLDRIQRAVAGSSREAFDQVSASTTDYITNIDRREPSRFIRRYPLPVALAAIGVGVALGVFLSRSSSQE